MSSSTDQPVVPGTTFDDCLNQMQSACATIPGRRLPLQGQDAQFAEWVLTWKDVAEKLSEIHTPTWDIPEKVELVMFRIQNWYKERGEIWEEEKRLRIEALEEQRRRQEEEQRRRQEEERRQRQEEEQRQRQEEEQRQRQEEEQRRRQKEAIAEAAKEAQKWEQAARAKEEARRKEKAEKKARKKAQAPWVGVAWPPAKRQQADERDKIAALCSIIDEDSSPVSGGKAVTLKLHGPRPGSMSYSVEEPPVSESKTQKAEASETRAARSLKGTSRKSEQDVEQQLTGEDRCRACSRYDLTCIARRKGVCLSCKRRKHKCSFATNTGKKAAAARSEEGTASKRKRYTVESMSPAVDSENDEREGEPTSKRPRTSSPSSVISASRSDDNQDSMAPLAIEVFTKLVRTLDEPGGLEHAIGAFKRAFALFCEETGLNV